MPKFNINDKVRILEEGECQHLVEKGRPATGTVVSAGIQAGSITMYTIRLDGEPEKHVVASEHCLEPL